MSKQKLLVLGSTLPRVPGDGTPGFVLDLAREEQKRFDVTILAPYVQGAKQNELIDGCQIVRYKYWPFAHTLADGAILDNLKQSKVMWLQVPFLMLGLLIAIRKQQPKLIHAHWIIPQGLVAALAAPRAKLLITTHGGDIYALNNPVLKSLKRWVLRRATGISTVNSQMKQQLVAWGNKESKVQVLPMGVDLAAAAKPKTTRKENSLVVVGRLVEKKGIEFLLAALRLGLADSSLPKDLTLTIAGDGPIRKELEQKAAGLPVTFLGNQTQEQVRDLFAGSAIAVLPSVTAKSGDQEGLPVTLLEAAAAGAFVIASDLPGINEVIRDRETGLLVPQADAKALLAAIQTALSDQKLVASCQKALAKEVRRFDHAVVGDSYNKLLEALS
jgi:glycosyltransferase involved in cell wall biosynthesis